MNTRNNAEPTRGRSLVEDNLLLGWDAIATYTRQSRPTLIKKGYPVYRDSGGSVWADKPELDAHRVKISENIRKYHSRALTNS